MATYDIILHATRICDKDRADQSGSDDGNVTDWNTAAEFILATAFHTNSKAVRAVVLKLEWRDVTDSGSFADVAATGEIHYTTTTTVLSDDTSVVVGERKCSTFGDTWQNGLENENDNVAPDSGTYTLAEDYETEFHWALDPDSAEGNHQYEFRVWDTNNNVAVGTCGALITMALAPTAKGFSDSGSGSDVFATATRYKVDGITKDNAGSVLVSCQCFLVKDNGDDTYTFIDHQVSNGVTGAYSFINLFDNDSSYQVIAWKDDTPHVMDVTDHDLTPVVDT